MNLQTIFIEQWEWILICRKRKNRGRCCVFLRRLAVTKKVGDHSAQARRKYELNDRIIQFLGVRKKNWEKLQYNHSPPYLSPSAFLILFLTHSSNTHQFSASREYRKKKTPDAGKKKSHRIVYLLFNQSLSLSHTRTDTHISLVSRAKKSLLHDPTPWNTVWHHFYSISS